jgi:membrane dipeptidase
MQPPFVFDAHVDSIQRTLDLGHDLAVAGPGHLDLERGRAGGLGAVVLAAWCMPSFVGAEDPGRSSAPGPGLERPGGAFERTVALVECGQELAAQNPKVARLLLAGSDLEAARAAGQTGLILGIEGGHSIESSLDKLEHFHSLGVRLMTLVWNNHLPWIRSCQAVPDDLGFVPPAGLSDFGREVVVRMNALGMLVDVSHAGDDAFADALESCETPPIASHSGCRTLSAHPRNLTDAQLRRLGDVGGVVGIVFHGGFLDNAARAEDARIYKDEAYRAITGANPTAHWVAQSAYHQEHAAPLSLERVADHVMHAIDKAGVEHVGLGSDFDGIPRTPEGLDGAADYPNLAQALRARGLGAHDVDRVMGENFARVFRDVVRTSASLLP